MPTGSTAALLSPTTGRDVGRRDGREENPRLEEILRESRSVSTRLEVVTARLEAAVERLADELDRRPDADLPGG